MTHSFDHRCGFREPFGEEPGRTDITATQMQGDSDFAFVKPEWRGRSPQVALTELRCQFGENLWVAIGDFVGVCELMDRVGARQKAMSPSDRTEGESLIEKRLCGNFAVAKLKALFPCCCPSLARLILRAVGDVGEGGVGVGETAKLGESHHGDLGNDLSSATIVPACAGQVGGAGAK